MDKFFEYEQKKIYFSTCSYGPYLIHDPVKGFFILEVQNQMGGNANVIVSDNSELFAFSRYKVTLIHVVQAEYLRTTFLAY